MEEETHEELERADNEHFLKLEADLDGYYSGIEAQDDADQEYSAETAGAWAFKLGKNKPNHIGRLTEKYGYFEPHLLSHKEYLNYLYEQGWCFEEMELNSMCGHAVALSDSPIYRAAIIIDVLAESDNDDIITLLFRPHQCTATEFVEWLLRYYEANRKKEELEICINKQDSNSLLYSIQLPSSRNYEVGSNLIITAQNAFSMFLDNAINEAV
ncbi:MULTISPECIES: hypothetical protein [Vibrio]|uniref:hypothetical protein n=1 Tax=Vibrio TaxID=662 RepID=UPI002075F88A|nr:MULTISPECIES: hypothetical protein [Vibrio]USD35525.1 hypothetical protein J8Z27_23175 [Vibrio sp. SCSIO 43186]USD72649.1 hypothetical protein J4N41_23180 [Vibrio sp. SCSIO 43139]USD98860.1 hypothetical protein CTT30_22520 [Vibrio coralliilyticus]